MATGTLTVSLAAVAENYRRIVRVVSASKDVEGGDGGSNAAAALAAAGEEGVAAAIRRPCRVGCVVKADCYGLGVRHVVPVLRDEGCNLFLVAMASEAPAVRAAAGPGVDIGVLSGFTVSGGKQEAGSSDDDAALYFDLDLIPYIASLGQLHAFRRRATATADASTTSTGAAQACSPACGYSGTWPCRRVVLHVETGMHRLGMTPVEVTELEHSYAEYTAGLDVLAVMSHPACADAATDERQQEQHAAFTGIADRLEKAAAQAAAGAAGGSAGGGGGPRLQRSFANSSSIFRDAPRYHHDFVRAGRALYGLDPVARFAPSAFGGRNPMCLAVHVVAPIAQVRTGVAAGARVGYDALHEVTQPGSTLCVIPVGYADGILRSLSRTDFSVFWVPHQQEEGGAAVLTNTTAPVPMRVCGLVSMDSIIVEFPSPPPTAPLSPPLTTQAAQPWVVPQEGDVVEVIGPHQSPDRVAALAGTNGYEVLTSLGQRYRRRYVYDQLTPITAAAPG